MLKLKKVDNAFEKFKTKMKAYKKPQNCSDLLVKKCNKNIWQERMNFQDRNKDLKAKGPGGSSQRSICHL